MNKNSKPNIKEFGKVFWLEGFVFYLSIYKLFAAMSNSNISQISKSFSSSLPSSSYLPFLILEENGSLVDA